MVSEHGNVIYYQGDGVTTTFSYPYDVHEPTDIHVLLINEENETHEIVTGFIVNTNNHTVTYPAYPSGQAPVNPPLPVQSGEKLCIYSLTPVSQDVDLPDKYPYDRIEAGLDKLTIIEQQNRAIFNRSFTMDYGTDITGINLKLPAPKPKTILVWNETGTALETVDLQYVIDALTALARQYAEASQASASNAATSEDNAKTWAEGEDAKVEPLGGEHSSKGWATIAKGYKENAANSADDARASADNAAMSEANASASASFADERASDAQTSALNASNDAANASAAAQAAQSLVNTSLYDNGKTYQPGETAMLPTGDVYRCITESTGEYPATSIKWVSVATSVMHTFERDENGDLMPLLNPQASLYWTIDNAGDICPLEY